MATTVNTPNFRFADDLPSHVEVPDDHPLTRGARGRVLGHLVASILMTAIAVAALLPSTAHALGETTTLSQSSHGSVDATLSGLRYPCTFAFFGSPLVRISANDILVISRVVGLGCPIIAGSSPNPYQQSATFGPLADGAYIARWTTGDPRPGDDVQPSDTPEFDVRQSFVLREGVLVAAGPVPIPGLSDLSLILCSGLLAGVAALTLRG